MFKTICIVTDSWKPQLSGVVNTLNQTIACLEADGYTVDVIEPSQFRSVSAAFIAPNLNFALPPIKMDALVHSSAVHIATEGPLGWAARRFCEKNGIAYSTAYHTSFPLYMLKNWGVPQWITYAYLKRFHKNSAKVLVPTKSIIDDLEGHGFKNCELWGRGVDGSVFNQTMVGEGLCLFEQNYPRPYFLNVGRVSREKNLDAFLELDLPGTKFIVGEGPDERRLRTKFPAAAVFLGKKSGDELADLYRTADVFVFPSWFDTFGLVNIESIACGTPVAAFPAPGPIDIIEQGVTGICDLDLHKACMAALALGEFSREFSWEAATRQFVQNLQFGE